MQQERLTWRKKCCPGWTGSTLASVDTVHTDSNLQTTGRALDLGIEGDGYFVLGIIMVVHYDILATGNFYLDKYGTLVNADGLNVKGFKSEGIMGDVAINVNAVQPATVTSEISFTGNLSSGTIAKIRIIFIHNK